MVNIVPPQDWPDTILGVAKTFMNAEVCFYEESGVTEPYDPITGNGGATGVTVIWSGKARVQHLGQPSQFQTSYNTESSHMFRFQLDPGDNPPILHFGMKARVINGGRDSGLENYVYVVNGAVNSSHMAVRTVELESTLEPINWSWEPTIVTLFPSETLYPALDLYPTEGN